ncbi:MAG TPA: hypothetical protein VGP07_15990 [Polyangia bacterium]|jgi:hypothetical protein
MTHSSRNFRLAILLGLFGGGALGCTGAVSGAGASGGSGSASGSGGNGSGDPGSGGTGAGSGGRSGSGGGTAAGSGGNGSGNPGSGGTGPGSGGGSGSGGTYGGGSGGDGGDSGGFTAPASEFAALRKIKSVLTGLAPTDADVTAAKDTAGLRTLIDAWMATPQFQDKMILFFGNSYQQTSLAQLDFEFQLRKRPGAFDLPYNVFGDNAFPLLFKNLKESFARTAFELGVTEGKPFTNILTTTQFMMTTALKSVYMQIEMPYDIHTMTWQFNHGTRPSLTDTLDPSSPNYLIFGYAAPTTTTGKGPAYTTCAGDSTKVSTYPGSTYLFQVLLGVVPRDSSNNGAGTTDLECFEHAIQPYFTAQDLSDWQMVNIANSGTPLKSYDLPGLRASGGTLASKLPRVSFFTTPAFLAVWNTNDSNQHRVTANQALLAALGQGFTSTDSIIPTPPSTTGLDGTHAVTGSVCYGCHKSLDPMKKFWEDYYDYNDQVNAKPSTGGSFGFGDVAQNGTSLVDFGRLMGTVTDNQVDGQPVNRFALATTQKLCFFANSAKCEESDPEMRRVALLFQNANYDFKTLVRELFSSPLVTSAASTATFVANGVTISVTRRDQLCAALSNRLGVNDLCDIQTPTPTDVTSATNKLAGAIPADAFSRGTEFPVTSPDPNLFYRAATELVCEAIAKVVVDGTTNSVFASSNVATAIEDMVTRVMGVPPSDPHHAGSVTALMGHYTAAMGSKATATNSLRSVFSAACQSPPSVALGI